jgi:hypothetical protein
VQRIILKKMPKSHSLREKNVKLLQLDIILVEVNKTKQDSKYFQLSCLTSSQIWLNPFVHDRQSTTSQDWKKLLVVSILSTGYCLDGPLQKCHQLRWNLSRDTNHSGWITKLRRKKKKTESKCCITIKHDWSRQHYDTPWVQRVSEEAETWKILCGL